MAKKCVICGKGMPVKLQVEYKDVGVGLGRFPAEVCTSCGEAIFSEETARKIETLEKKLGIFGLEEKAKVRKSGNSLTLTITTKIANFLGLKEGTEVILKPADRKVLMVIESS